MTTPLILGSKDCQGKAWHPPQDAGFAQHLTLLPLHAGEMAKAATAMPLALIQEGRDWRLVGVCGLEPGHNVFIRQGQWLTNYHPEWLSTYPFETIAVRDKILVGIDRDSGLVDDTGAGEPFFDAEGEMTQAVAQRVEILKKTHRKQRTTEKAIAQLVKAGVVAAWPESLSNRLGITLDGLHMIDEKALAALDDKAFLNLRKAQALPIAYALNLSLQQAHLLTRLANRNPPPIDTPAHLESFFEHDDGELHFDFDN